MMRALAEALPMEQSVCAQKEDVIETTLYDLVEACHDVAMPDEEELILPTVLKMLASGRLTFA